MISGAGSSQDGSLRAEKILKDDKRAAFDTIRTIAFDKLPGLSQHFKRKLFKRAWLLFVTWPRAETSTAKKETTRVSERSETSGAYFSDLNKWLRSMFESHGQVSSKIITSWDSWLKTNTSGFRAVGRMWGGIVPPWGAWWPGISEYKTMPFFKCGWINRKMEDRTELCRHVRRPWVRAVEQLDKTCASVSMLPQKLHLSLVRLPHLFKLSYVGKVFSPAFKANFKTPCGISHMKLFQEIQFYSSINNAR